MAVLAVPLTMVISLFAIPDTVPLRDRSQPSQLQLHIYVRCLLGGSGLVVALPTSHASFLSFAVFLPNPVLSVGPAPEMKQTPKGSRLFFSFEL